jgi:hypothetical protein
MTYIVLLASKNQSIAARRLCVSRKHCIRRGAGSEGEAKPDWWRDLGQVTLTPSIIDRLVASTEDLIVAQGSEQLAARRDGRS